MTTPHPTHKLVPKTAPDGGGDFDIQPGAQILNFRGEPWQFVSISRVPGFSRGGLDYSDGKIIVVRPGEDANDPGWTRELYPSVFDLKIVKRNTERKPMTTPTDRQLSLAHFADHPSIRALKESLEVQDLVDAWEAISNWVEEAEDFTPDSEDGFTPEELEEFQRERETNARMEVLMERFHKALSFIPQDLR